jgi:hypothetical protein
MSCPRLRCAILVLALALAGCATSPPRPAPPSVAEVVTLSGQGEAPEVIIQRMKDGRGLYSLSGSELAELGAKGVAPEVLDYMQQTLLEAQIARERLRMQGPYMVGPGLWGRGFYGPWGLSPWLGPGPGYWGPYFW